MQSIMEIAFRRSRRRALLSMGIGFFASSLMAQTTVGEGVLLPVTSDLVFSASAGGLGTLTMDGGTIRMANGATGQAISITMLDAVLARGLFNNPYNQTGVSQLFFNGTTSLTGGPTGLPPADGMFIRASSFDSRGLQVYSSGILIQSGTGYLTTQGPVQFNNVGAFEIQNDLGFYAGSFPDFKSFFNVGIVRKTVGTATSFFSAAFHQDGGDVEAHSGSFAFANGGNHHNASFSANAGGNNPTGQIALGGVHTFTGTVVTHSGGRYGLQQGGSITISDVWDQRGLFVNDGSLRVSQTGILSNSGLFLPSSGSVTGEAGLVGGIVVNTSTGTFSQNILATNAPIGQEPTRLNVVNRGTFNINADQLVEVKNFVNESGTVTVNGDVSNVNGTFQLLGGVLNGNGIINGEVFVGGGPGTASFKPGSSPGTMTINGPLHLLPGGVLELEVERDPLSGAILYDQVVAESFFLDGQISFLIDADVEMADVAGLQFLQCTFGCNIEYGPGFSYAFPGRAAGSTLSFDSSGLAITSLAPVPEPETWAMLLAGLGLIGTLVRRRRQGQHGA